MYRILKSFRNIFFFFEKITKWGRTLGQPRTHLGCLGDQGPSLIGCLGPNPGGDAAFL